MLNDPLANVLSGILNNEKVGKRTYTAKPYSKILIKVLEVMKDNHYVGSFKEIEGNSLKINLIGNINKCGAVKPRYSVKWGQFEKFEERYLPAKGFGILILTTPLGVISHEEAKEKKTGGRLLAYCY